MRYSYKLNTEQNRAAVEMPFGIACYEGGLDSGEWKGQHLGVVGSWADAERWLSGDHVNLIRIYHSTGDHSSESRQYS